MKTRAFVRYTKLGKVVPGSLIITKGSYPKGSSTWKEVPADLCCDNPMEIRYVVANAAITNIALSLFCNGVSVANYRGIGTSSTDMATLLMYLNEMFGAIGVFSDGGGVNEILLTLDETMKNRFCPDGILTMIISAD